MRKFHLASVKSLFLVGMLPLSHLVLATCDDAHYQDFDFWLGKWQVTTPNGKVAGYNTIEKKHANCVLTESYHTDTGFSGQSLNIYNKNTGIWHQTWVDNSGTLLLLDGGMDGNSMVLKGVGKNKNGEQILHKISWTPNSDGTVRQHWQMSQGNEQIWTTLFDGLYKKI